MNDTPGRPWLAYTLLVATMLCWGANAVAGRFAAGHIDPLLLTNLRWGLAFLAVLAFAWPHLRADWPLIRQHKVLLAGYGAVGFASYNVLFYAALNFTSAVNVVIEQAAMPGVILALNFFVLRQTARPRQVFGFAVTVIGVVIIVGRGDPTRLLSLHLNQGDLLMLVAVLCYSGYAAALRLRPAIHWSSFIAAVSFAAWLSSLPLALWALAGAGAAWPDARGWGVAVFAALVPGVFAQSTFVVGNQLIGSNRAGIFINLVPIFGTLLALGLLAEPFHYYHAVALALVLGGIALAERQKPLPLWKAVLPFGRSRSR